MLLYNALTSHFSHSESIEWSYLPLWLHTVCAHRMGKHGQATQVFCTYRVNITNGLLAQSTGFGGLKNKSNLQKKNEDTAAGQVFRFVLCDCGRQLPFKLH